MLRIFVNRSNHVMGMVPGLTAVPRQNEPMRTNASGSPATVALRPLSTRSVILSLLLAVHPPELSVRELIRSVQPVGVAEATARVALSRMVASGDLHRGDSGYRLSDRLVERQRRQDDAVHPQTAPWGEAWEIVVITASGRPPAERAELREELSRLRLAELREGVWLRPANLRHEWPDRLARLTQRFTARPDQPHHALVDALWTIDGWASTATALLGAFTAAVEPSDTFTVAAAIVRHLLTDPVLPDELLPADWPAPRLRAAYASYQHGVLQLARIGRSSGPDRPPDGTFQTARSMGAVPVLGTSWDETDQDAGAEEGGGDAER